MSTHIYNAYIYRGKRLSVVSDIFLLSESIRSTLRPRCERMFFRQVGAQIAHHIDFASVRPKRRTAEGNDRTVGSIVYDEYKHAMDELRKGFREPSWDFNAEFTFYRVGAMLLLSIIAENDVIRVFEDLFPEFHDYHFQNASDSIPDGVSVRQWRLREKHWEIAFGYKEVTPRLLGSLRFSLWTENTGPRFDDKARCMARIPSFRKRLDTAARDYVRDKWIQRRCPDASSVPCSVVVGFLNKWRDAQKSTAVKRTLEKTRERFSRMIPERINIETLRSTVDQLRRAALSKQAVHSSVCKQQH